MILASRSRPGVDHLEKYFVARRKVAALKVQLPAFESYESWGPW
jgi:hypothetical protein